MIFLIYFFPAHVQCTSKKRKKVKLSGQLVLLILNFKETLTQKKLTLDIMYYYCTDTTRLINKDTLCIFQFLLLQREIRLNKRQFCHNLLAFMLVLSLLYGTLLFCTIHTRKSHTRKIKCLPCQSSKTFGE